MTRDFLRDRLWPPHQCFNYSCFEKVIHQNMFEFRMIDATANSEPKNYLTRLKNCRNTVERGPRRLKVENTTTSHSQKAPGVLWSGGKNPKFLLASLPLASLHSALLTPPDDHHPNRTVSCIVNHDHTQCAVSGMRACRDIHVPTFHSLWLESGTGCMHADA